MTSPPSSLPSPAPSASSSQHPHSFSSLAMPPSANVQRTHSTASGISVASGRDSKASGYLSNGHAPHGDAAYDGHVDGSQDTPQPQHNGVHYSLANQHPFLPPVTSSPPPRVVPYVPPPQHAMAPDPIHTMMSPHGLTSPGAITSPGGGWPNGPAGWRGAPPQPGYPGAGQHYNRQMPNGHLPGPGPSSHPSNPIEAYNGRMSMPPLATSGRPGSRQGDSRDRRSQRDEKDADDEVITTIFVVGFPDDMLEREFQNIFTFTPGFEAATLKFPSGANRPREPAAALLAELQTLAASQGGDFGEYGIPPPLEEAIAALQLSTASSSSTTPSAAISMTPSAPTGPVLGGAPYASQSTRRQTIGFARFKTRADALAAREHLQGRKIDMLTGATLKAEMAKKNLHTKRTTTGEELVGLLLRSGRLAGLMGGTVPGQAQPNIPNGTGPYGAQQYQPPLHPPPNSAISNSQPHAPIQPQSAKEAWDSWPSSQPSSHESRSEERVPQQGQLNNQYQPYSAPHAGAPSGPGNLPSSSDLSNASASPPMSITSPNTRPTDSKALLALAEEADEMEGWSMGGAGMAFDGFTPRRPNHSQPQPIVHGSAYPGTYGQHGMGPGNGRDMFGSSPPGGSDHMSDAGRSMGMMSGNNPADQNPPINTLYVGNLPAVSPPTLPPNYLEESLRALFQTCHGYKRMSFRQKINGPMCFVEFEDVNYAQNAIQHLYGHSLNNLVKGGIRLSYSKNSLGQRGASHPAGNGNPGFGGMPHNVGMAGLASPTHAYQQIPGYGLPNGHQGQSAPPGPGTAPMYNPSGGMSHSAPLASGQPSTSLSPNAQPFALPPTSPRSRYFGAPPNGAGPAPLPVPVPVPSSRSDPNASFSAFQGTSSNQLSPVGSPIRTPGSYSWVSSGSGVNGNSGFSGFTLGSLDGAASAWGTSGKNPGS